jgi:hypothetical protein
VKMRERVMGAHLRLAAGSSVSSNVHSCLSCASEGVLRRHSMRRGASMRYMPPNEHALFTAARNVPPDESS